ncbi:MAG TPA: DUF1223 domain-containing protein [Pyrinomonadaceae bacterium]|jgi:hypothetical protein
MQRWTALLLMAAGVLVVAIIIARAGRGGADFDQVFAVDGQSRPASAPGQRAPVLIELFTSEGCSSCPPADELLRRLAETQPVAGAEVIALEQHVDYWNRLGWADPFSAPEFSARQGDYAAYFNSSGVYTPQMIVDGQTEFPGGNTERARAAIVAAAQRPKATISLARNGATQPEGIPLSVRVEQVPAVAAGDTVEVLLALTEDALRTDVPRGENAGRKLAHAAVVRALSSLGQINAPGGPAFVAQPVVALSTRWQLKNLRAVVFVQERNSRRVLGAAALRLATE